jgi:hypothetical protein
LNDWHDIAEVTLLTHSPSVGGKAACARCGKPAGIANRWEIAKEGVVLASSDRLGAAYLCRSCGIIQLDGDTAFNVRFSDKINLEG